LLLLPAGEIHELKEELHSLDRPKKKEAVKKVIAAMTVGKDVRQVQQDARLGASGASA
jgi:AP-1 complex subunit beta-1